MLAKLIVGSLMAASLLLPAKAMAAENLDCLATGYSTEAQQRIDNFVGSLRLDGDIGDISPDLPDEIGSDLVSRGADCADLHGWSQQALEFAIISRFLHLFKQGLLANTPLTPIQQARLDRQLASPESEQAREIARRLIIDMFTTRRAPELSEADELVFARMALRVGVPATSPGGKFVGGYLVVSAAVDHFASQFSSQ